MIRLTCSGKVVEPSHNVTGCRPIMIRLTPPRLAALLLLVVLTGPAAAETPIPDITAEAWPHPIGDYLPLRVIITNSINARNYANGDRVHGGVLTVDYRISCEAVGEGAACPSSTLRTGTTTIPCGEQEGGMMHYNIAHLKGKGPLTIKLIITAIRFHAWGEDTINRVNDRYRPWPNGTLACPVGSYSSVQASTGPNWTSPPATVR